VDPGPEAWKRVAEAELQRIGLEYLLSSRDVYGEQLLEQAPDVLERIDAARRNGRVGAIRSVASPPNDLKISKEIHTALDNIRYPQNTTIARVAKARRYKFQINFPRFRLIEHDVLLSPHVHYVTDIDMTFMTERPSKVSTVDFDAQVEVARKLFDGSISKAKVMLGGMATFDREVKSWTVLREAVRRGADVTVLSGRSRVKDGWLLPMDLVLKTCNDDRISKADHLDQMRKNLDWGEYVKVISHLRAMLRHEEQIVFDHGWNVVGGRMQFLVKQLGMLRQMPERKAKTYLKSHLRLRWGHGLEALSRVAEAELQHIGLEYLLASRSVYEKSFLELAPDVLERIDVASGHRGSAAPGRESGFVAAGRDSDLD